MKIKIYNTNESIDCEPTQEAIEAVGIDTFGKTLVITKERTYWLITSFTAHNIEKKDWIMPIKSYYDYNH